MSTNKGGFMQFSKKLATILLSLASVGAQAANLVSNGSFEANLMTSGKWSTFQSLTDWSSTNRVELRNNVAGKAQDGFNFVELDVSGNSSISQTIFATGWVDLSFWYSARPKTGAATNDLTVNLGDFSAIVLKGISNSTGSHNWQQFTQRIDLGNTGSAALTFAAAGASDSYGGSLDNISVSAVPEPGTYLMFLTGLGLLAAVNRRRTAKR
jgi:hypothetical protein